MTQSFSAFFALGFILCATTVDAERLAPEKVMPVVAGGVRYSAPNDDGRHAMVQATDTTDGRLLWKKEIFSTWIRPDLEEDVQWEFIRTLRLHGDQLIVTSEGWRTYSLDLRTLRVRSLDVGDPIPIMTFVGLATCAALTIWLVARRFLFNPNRD